SPAGWTTAVGRCTRWRSGKRPDSSSDRTTSFTLTSVSAGQNWVTVTAYDAGGNTVTADNLSVVLSNLTTLHGSVQVAAVDAAGHRGVAGPWFTFLAGSLKQPGKRRGVGPACNVARRADAAALTAPPAVSGSPWPRASAARRRRPWPAPPAPAWPP